MSIERGTESKCSKKATASNSTCSCKTDNTVVPVFTDTLGRIHIDKEFCKEQPEITKKLLDGEIERNKSRSFLFSSPIRNIRLSDDEDDESEKESSYSDDDNGVNISIKDLISTLAKYF